MRKYCAVLVLTVVASTVFPVAPVQAGHPERVVFHPDPGPIPAGFGCGFEMGRSVDANASVMRTTFADGRVQTIGHANITFTNMETGTAYLHRSRYRAVDVVTGDQLHSEASGRLFIQLYPGDQGPEGVVGAVGAAIGVVGHVQVTVDLTNDLFTSFSFTGTITDICGALGS